MKPLPQLALSGLIGLAPAFAETVFEKQPQPAKWLKGEPVAAFERDTADKAEAFVRNKGDGMVFTSDNGGVMSEPITAHKTLAPLA